MNTPVEKKYEKIVLAQQGYDSQTIPYQRGDIVDAKGTVLATSIAVYNVILDCSVLNDDEKYVEPTINALVSCFPDLTSEQLYSYLKDSPDSRYIVLAKRLSYDTIQPFVNLQEERDEKENWLIHISKVFGLKKSTRDNIHMENWQVL